jgi:hypothetical protein
LQAEGVPSADLAGLVAVMRFFKTRYFLIPPLDYSFL